MTRRRYLRELASAWSFGRGETYDSLIVAQSALAPVAAEIRESGANLTPGSISEGAVLNIQINVRDCRAILAAVKYNQEPTP